MLAIRLPSEIETRLDALAKATGRTKTNENQSGTLDGMSLPS